MQLPSITPSAAQPIQQAELLLKLYELRREAVMRQARGFIGGGFLPSSAANLVAQVSAGNQHSGFILSGIRLLGHGFGLRDSRRSV